MILRQQYFFRPRTNTVTPNYRNVKVTSSEYAPKHQQVEVDEDRNIPGKSLAAIVASAYVGVPMKNNVSHNELAKDPVALPYAVALLALGLYLAKKK